MTSIAIRTEDGELGQPRFRAVAGSRESVGRTMGEALDALTAEWGEEIQEAGVLIPRFQPDAYFTEAQHSRMEELLARRADRRGARGVGSAPRRGAGCYRRPHP